MEITLIILLSYLIGSIPSAVIVSQIFYGLDIRQRGSGNMGSTNTFRVLGWKAGICVQLLDVAKGVTAVWAAGQIFNGLLPFPNPTPFEQITIVKTIAGIAAVIGHIWPAFASFRGGKGINTALGMLIGVMPIELAVASGAFIVVILASGYVSLASMIAAVSLPITMTVRYTIFDVEIDGYSTLIFFMTGLAALLVYAHRTNIRRLLAGSENRANRFRIFRPKSPQPR